MNGLLFALVLAAAPAPDAARGAALNAQAIAETNAGKYDDALRHAKESAAIFTALRDDRGRSLALNLGGLAQLYAGDYRAAQASFTSAIAASTAARDDALLCEQLTNLGNVHYFLGRYADAAATYDAVMQIVDKHRGEAWTARRRRLVVVNRATLDQRLGLDERALSTYREALAGGDLRPREQAQILTNLGVLYRRLGDPIKALAMYDDALALFAREKLLDGELGAMKNRGIVLALDLGRLDDARRNFSEAYERAAKASDKREMLQAQLYRAETELRGGALADARADFDAAAAAAHALGTKEEEWKALYGRGRVALREGRAADAEASLRQSIAIIENIREAIRVPLMKSDFFNDKREVYDALIGASLASLPPAEVFALIERSHSRAWRERLGLNAPVTAVDVQKRLPAGAMLLDCWSSSAGSAVAVVTRDRVEIRAVHVNDDAIRRLADALANGPSRDWRRIAASVAPDLLPPLPAGVAHVIVVPDGPLALVPFELLPSGARLLIEQAAVSYQPTAAMLFRTPAKPRRLAPPWTPELRAFGDPRFSAASLDALDAIRPRLAASAEEIRAIDRELGGKSALHLGADDRKAWLYDPREPAPILHIATHAAAGTEAIEQSRILFSPPTPNANGADYLFLKEAYDLPLRGVELAVLSACDTERGALLRGEGVQSFSRAFLAAGARSTVTTLWRVPDRETASLMKVFYYHLQRGASRAEALRQTKLRFVRAGVDPHYWAAFVLNGEAAAPIPRAMRWRSIGIVAAALLVAAAVLLLYGGRALLPVRRARRRKGGQA